ncbi:MAG: hypothetical protein AB7P69_13605, partial [Candidatus Binatia bacterium]
MQEIHSWGKKATSMALAVTLAATNLGGAYAGQKSPEADGVAVGNFKDVAAKVVVNGKTQSSTANGGVEFVIPTRAPHELHLKDFHLYARSVDVLLKGQKQAQPTGVLSIYRNETLPLKVDSTGGFSGEFEAKLHYPLIDQLIGWRKSSEGKGEADHFAPITDRVRVTLSGKLDKPLTDRSPEKEELRTVEAKATIKSLNASLASFLLELRWRFVIIVYNPNLQILRCLGPVKRMCIQPVGIKDNANDPFPTGTAFPLLMDEARDMWERACVRFDVKDFEYLIDPQAKTLTASFDNTSPEFQDMLDVINSVDDENCVEVFFIESWTNPELFGGGATFSSGTASAKILTSDQNDNGIDFNHLAHELGHVLGLGHPGNTTDGLT